MVKCFVGLPATLLRRKPAYCASRTGKRLGLIALTTGSFSTLWMPRVSGCSFFCFNRGTDRPNQSGKGWKPIFPMEQAVITTDSLKYPM